MRSKMLCGTAWVIAVATLAACDQRQPAVASGPEETLTTLRERDPNLRSDWNAEQGRIVLFGRLDEGAAGEPVTIARSFMRQHSIPRRQDSDEFELVVESSQEDETGWQHVRFEQRYRDLAIWAEHITVHLAPDGAVRGLTGRYLPDGVEVDTRAQIDGEEAVALALAEIEAGRAEAQPFEAPELMVFNHDGRYRAAWRVVLPGTSDDGTPAVWRAFVDAITGQVLEVTNQVRTFSTEGIGTDCDLGERVLKVFSADGEFRLQDITRVDAGGSEIQTRVPGGDFSTDSDGSWDGTQLPVRDSQQVEVSIHYWLGVSYDTLRELTGRDGWDNQGFLISASAHYPNANNAFYDPQRKQLGFGESHGSTRRAFGCANDVIAHEFMHGVVDQTGILDDGLEANAMNESFSDMFGAMVDVEDWLMGEGTSQSGMTAIRDLGNPTRLGDPGHYDDLSGGAHNASNITSHAFFLAADGLRHTTGSGYRCDVSLGRRTTFEHFYYVLENFLRRGSDMGELAEAVTFTAREILAQGRGERADVFAESFRRVGLGSGGQGLACVEPWVWVSF